MDELFIGLALGISLTLLFIAGCGVNHKLESDGFRKRVTAVHTPETHRNEAERLLRQSIRADKYPDYQRYLRNEAFQHYQQADLLENGPYYGFNPNLSADYTLHGQGTP